MVAQKLRTFRTNLKKTAHYDQIAYYADNTECEIGKAGVIDFYDAFFRASMSRSANELMTFQISDHLPLWLEIRLCETDLDAFIKTSS